MIRRLNDRLRNWLGEEEHWKYILTGAGAVIVGFMSCLLMLLNALVVLF